MDPYPAMNLELMDSFGLRLKESILIRPVIAWCGDALKIVDGTKGGRPRVVPVRTQQQRDVLTRAIALASSSFVGSMVPPGKNLKQTLQRAYYIFRKAGITKAKLNITPHGLRHGYANDRFEEVSGMLPTVRGGHGENYDRPKDLAARMVVSEELGHSRVNITAAYTGARKRGRPTLMK
jgi:integrase